MKSLSDIRPASAMRRIMLMLTALLFAANAAVAQMIVSGACGKTENDNVTWSYTTLANTNILTIAGTGEMADYNSNNHAPWYEYKDDIKTVVIGEGVTSIGKYAFYGLSKLTSVSISASVACICSNAFEESGLTSIAFAEGSQLTSIGISAFCDCSRLASITIPVKVTNIDNFAFWGCGLTSVTFAEGSQLTSIGAWAFSECSVLTSITIPASVTIIGENAFFSCSALPNINVEEGNTEYASENGVLFNKDKTTLLCYPAGKTESSYNIPLAVTNISTNAFFKCSDLTSITIPASVTSIGYSSFMNCGGLTSVTILAPSLETYGNKAFDNNAAGRKIYVPEESVDTYKAGWPYYTYDIFPIPDDPTSIGNATMPSGNAQAADEAWYSLDGRKLSSKPTERGVYLHLGRKVVVK